MELSQHELTTIYGWGQAIDGEWGLSGYEKDLLARLRAVVMPDIPPEPDVELVLSPSEVAWVRSALNRQRLDEGWGPRDQGLLEKLGGE